MSRHDANRLIYDEVTIFDRPALFTECRIDRATVPEGVYRYELRHGDEDWGEPIELARSIFANYYGAVLTRAVPVPCGRLDSVETGQPLLSG